MSAFDKDIGDILAKSRHEAAVAAARDQELAFMADQIEQAKAREENTRKILTETQRGADDLKRQRYEQDMRFAELTKQCQGLEDQLAERSDELEKAYLELKDYQLATNKQAATIEELQTAAKGLTQ